MSAALCLINCLKREKGAFGVAAREGRGRRRKQCVAWQKEEEEEEEERENIWRTQSDYSLREHNDTVSQFPSVGLGGYLCDH